MIVVISTADYLLPHTPSFVKVTSAGGERLLKKEHSALPSSYPASNGQDWRLSHRIDFTY